MIKNLIILAIVILSMSSCYGEWATYDSAIVVTEYPSVRYRWEYAYPSVRYRVYLPQQPRPDIRLPREPRRGPSGRRGSRR